MGHQPSPERAAHNIVQSSFGLRPDQDLLIFADPGSLEAANLVAETARRCGVFATVFFVPHLIQSEFGPNESLPLPVEAAIREADAVLSCLSGRPEHLTYRRRVLRTSWSRRVKLAHAPGLTLEVLRLADTDFGFMRRRCQTLATALVLGRVAEVITGDSQGRQHRLLVDLPGWDFPPGISDGRIADGAWTNLPPGETFIVPANARGTIAVNGAIPGQVMGPADDLIATFKEGRLVTLEPPEGAAVRLLHANHIAYAQRQGDPNWSNLAELGFGVNPAISRLTGIQLVDEKMADTVHVALGDSDSLGGRVESSIHCDLVVAQATVRIDGRTLMEAGSWRGDDEDWRLDHAQAGLPGGWWANVGQVRRSGVRAEIVADRLVRHWHSGPGRRDSMPVGSESTAQAAARLYRVLPENGGHTTKRDLVDRAAQLGMDEATLAPLLWVMGRYDLVRFPGAR